MSKKSFLVIVTDQHRFDAVGAHGSPICQTPALDRLAASGTRFDNAYSICALSSPARASMYTGLYPHRHGLVVNEDEFFDDVRLVSEDFRDAGYACGFAGKWHCGVEKLPRRQGKDGAVGTRGRSSHEARATPYVIGNTVTTAKNSIRFLLNIGHLFRPAHYTMFIRRPHLRSLYRSLRAHEFTSIRGCDRVLGSSA